MTILKCKFFFRQNFICQKIKGILRKSVSLNSRFSLWCTGLMVYLPNLLWWIDQDQKNLCHSKQRGSCPRDPWAPGNIYLQVGRLDHHLNQTYGRSLIPSFFSSLRVPSQAVLSNRYWIKMNTLHKSTFSTVKFMFFRYQFYRNQKQLCIGHGRAIRGACGGVSPTFNKM